jgi:hypothetical protein
LLNEFGLVGHSSLRSDMPAAVCDAGRDVNRRAKFADPSRLWRVVAPMSRGRTVRLG